MSRDRAKAVPLASGERIALDGVVASNVDPRHFALDLLGEATLGSGITERIKRYEWGSSFFVIYAALDRPVSYRAGAAGDSAGYVHAVGQKLDELAETFAQCRACLLPSAPMLGIINEAGIDPTRAQGAGADEIRGTLRALSGDGRRQRQDRRRRLGRDQGRLRRH